MFKKIFLTVAMLLAVIALSGAASAIDASFVEVYNNVGTKDVVQISGLEPRSNVQISLPGGKLLAKKTLSRQSTELKFSGKYFGDEGGMLVVTVTEYNGSPESVYVSYDAKPVSSVPVNVDITINVDKKDTVYVADIDPKTQVRVYNSTTGRQIASGKVGAAYDDITLSCKSLGLNGGTVDVTITEPGKLESPRESFSFLPAPKTLELATESIEITNNVSKKDTFVVTDLEGGEVVTVYNEKGKKLVSGKYNASKDNLTLSIKQLGTERGTIKYTVKEPNKLVSEEFPLTFPAEPKTPELSEPDANGESDDVLISNNPSGTKSTIYIENLEGGDIVKVYQSADTEKVFLKGTVGSNSSEITLSKTKFEKGGGSFWISVTRKGMLESPRVKFPYDEVPMTAAVYTTGSSTTDNVTTNGSVIITNNAGQSDSIYISDLDEESTVKAYKAEKGTSSYATGKVAASASSVTLTASQLGKNGGSVWLSVKAPDKEESDRVEVSFGAECKSKLQIITSGTPESGMCEVEVENNAGSAATIEVYGLDSGDIVKIYSKASGGSSIGTATTAKYESSVTLSVSQLAPTGGSVYITRTQSGCLESDRVEILYAAVESSTTPIVGNISVTNNSGMASTVKVTGLIEKDVIKAYNKETGGSQIGTGTVSEYNSVVTFNVSSLSASGGELWLTKTSQGKAESVRVHYEYGSQKASSALNADIVSVENNVGMADAVEIYGLSSGDVVNVYNAAGELLGTGKATSDFATVRIAVTGLSTDGGTIYVSVISAGRTESVKTAVAYSAEEQTAAPTVSSISVLNRAGSVDEVTVYGLFPGDQVKIYATEQSATAIGTATVGAGSYSVTVNVALPGSTSGSVYVSVKSSGKYESARTEAAYLGESAAPVANDIEVQNNATMASTVKVKGLSEGDVVKVYDSAGGTRVIGMATAASDTVTISVSQLTAEAGRVYVSVTNYGRCESLRTAAEYMEIGTSNPLQSSYVSITDNGEEGCTISIATGLTAGDIVRIYDGENQNAGLLASGTADSSGKVSLKLKASSDTGRIVYISVTGYGKYESNRTALTIG